MNKSAFISFTAYLDVHSTNALKIALESDSDWYAYGVEKCPTTGRIHWQGIAYKKEEHRWVNLRKVMHVEPAKKPQALLKYT